MADTGNPFILHLPETNLKIVGIFCIYVYYILISKLYFNRITHPPTDLQRKTFNWITHITLKTRRITHKRQFELHFVQFPVFILRTFRIKKKKNYKT